MCSKLPILNRYIPWYTVLYIFCEVRIRVRVGVIISVQGLFAVLSCVGVLDCAECCGLV